MTITSIAGTTASVSDSVVVADAVTTCAGSGCTGTVTTPQQNVGISSTSTSGSIQTNVDPANNSYSCGDPFRHAPQVTTVTDTGLNANIVYTVTFANKAAAGAWFVPFAVCYQSQTPFKDLYGHTVTTGLLPLCTLLPRPGKPLVAPCVQSITELPLYIGNVVEKIVLPAGDPRFHYRAGRELSARSGGRQPMRPRPEPGCVLDSSGRRGADWPMRGQHDADQRGAGRSGAVPGRVAGPRTGRRIVRHSSAPMAPFPDPGFDLRGRGGT